jgi:peptide/nickel transport system substrate-binding protein
VLALLTALARPAFAQGRETLTIGISQFPATLHPAFEAMLAKSYVLGFVRRPLVAYDARWRLACLLCTELPTLENGLARRETTPDGKAGVAMTFTVREDATWADGTPVTSRDAHFTWRAGRESRTGIIPSELYRTLYRLDVVDERTFTLHADKLSHDFNALNSFELLPAHLDEATLADPETFRNRSRYVTDPTDPGLYNGPYRIAEVTPGAQFVLLRNPHWGGARPAFERIVIRAIENTAALEANLLSGSIDMIAGELGLNLDQAAALERRHGQRFTVRYQSGLFYENITLNLDNPILADRRVRQALVHALDREAISARVFGGRQPVAHGSVSPLDPMHDAETPRYDHDPKRAANLLDEAGWAPGPGGVRVNGKGEPLVLEIMTTAGDRTRELVQQILQDQWRQVGIDVRIRNQPARVFFGEAVSRRQFPAMAMFAWLSSPDSVPRTVLHSTQIPSAGNSFSGQNASGYRNAEVDGLIEAIEVELDRERRRGLWRRLQRIYAEEIPAIPLFFRANAFVLPIWLDGVEPTGHRDPSSLWVETWRVR